MATIFNTIAKVGSDPQAAIVTIELVWDTTVAGMARSTLADVSFEADFNTEVDELGYWSLNVTSNDNILPADSVYRITEVGENTVTYYISVPDSATPSFFVGDILAATPGWL